MRATRAFAYEGGHRVPLFVHWPAGGWQGGLDIGGLTCHLDLLPRLTSLAGVEAPEVQQFDGRSLVPLVNGQDTFAHRGLDFMGEVSAYKWILEREILTYFSGNLPAGLGKGLSRFAGQRHFLVILRKCCFYWPIGHNSGKGSLRFSALHYLVKFWLIWFNRSPNWPTVAKRAIPGSGPARRRMHGGSCGCRSRGHRSRRCGPSRGVSLWSNPSRRGSCRSG